MGHLLTHLLTQGTRRCGQLTFGGRRCGRRCGLAAVGQFDPFAVDIDPRSGRNRVRTDVDDLAVIDQYGVHGDRIAVGFGEEPLVEDRTCPAR